MRGQRLDFDGCVVLVTGAGRGMGRAHARLLAGRGATVVVSDVGTDLHGCGADPGPAHETVALIEADGGTASAHTADLSTELGARDAVRSAVERHGRLDAVVHNAGFTLGGCEFAADSLDRLDGLLAINTRAAFAVANEAWPVMSAQRFGRIVLVGSTAIYGMAQSVAYATAKASYLGLTRSLARAGAEHGIRVNTIAPAGATRMAETMAPSEFRTWFLSVMAPELVSPLVALLVHERCPVNGEHLVVGGGRIARTLLVETEGHVDTDPTPESVEEQLALVLADLPDGRLHVPRDTAASGALAAAVLGFDGNVPVTMSMQPQRTISSAPTTTGAEP